MNNELFKVARSEVCQTAGFAALTIAGAVETAVLAGKDCSVWPVALIGVGLGVFFTLDAALKLRDKELALRWQKKMVFSPKL